MIHFYLKQLENVQNVPDFLDLYKSLSFLLNFERQIFPSTLLNQLQPVYSSLYPANVFSMEKKSTKYNYQIVTQSFMHFKNDFNFDQLIYIFFKNGIRCKWIRHSILDIFSSYLNDTNFKRICVDEIYFLKRKRILKLEQTTFDAIFNLFSSTIDLKEKVMCAIILLSEENKSYNQLSSSLDFAIQIKKWNNEEFSLFLEITNNLDFFKRYFSDKVDQIFGNLIKLIKQEAEEFNFKNDKFFTVLDTIVKIQQTQILTQKEYSSLKQAIISNTKKLEKQIEPDKDLITRIYYGLKIIVAMTKKTFDENYLIDLVRLNNNFLNLLNKKNLFFANYLTKKQVLDCISLFALFNEFDINNIKDECKDSLNNLKRLHKNWYANAKKTRPFDETGLIWYNMSQLNLNINNEESILDLTEKINSLDDLTNFHLGKKVNIK